MIKVRVMPNGVQDVKEILVSWNSSLAKYIDSLNTAGGIYWTDSSGIQHYCSIARVAEVQLLP